MSVCSRLGRLSVFYLIRVSIRVSPAGEVHSRPWSSSSLQVAYEEGVGTTAAVVAYDVFVTLVPAHLDKSLVYCR